MARRRIPSLLILFLLASTLTASPASATSCAGESPDAFTLTGTLAELEHVDLYDGGDDQFRSIIDVGGERTEFLLLGNARAMRVGSEYQVTIHPFGRPDPSLVPAYVGDVAFLHADGHCSLPNTVFEVAEGGTVVDIGNPSSTTRRIIIGGAGLLFAAFLAIQQARSRLQTKDPDVL